MTFQGALLNIFLGISTGTDKPSFNRHIDYDALFTDVHMPKTTGKNTEDFQSF